MIDILNQRSKVIVAGHRGMKAIYPENTLLSFKKAIELGVDMLEFDLNITSDKHIVVIHDNMVDRTTNGTGYVHDYTLKQLKELDAGSKFGVEFKDLKIPTFDEFCDLIRPYPRLLLNVEIKEKTQETVDLTMDMLQRYGYLNRCVFTCFDAAIVRYMVDRYSVKTQGFLSWKMKNFIEGENGTYSKIYAIGIDMQSLTPELVQEFEEKNILPWCYCPDDDEQVHKALICKARLITTNNPECAIRILRERSNNK